MIAVDRVFKNVKLDDEDGKVLDGARETLKGLALQIQGKYPEYEEKTLAIYALREALYLIELTMAQQDKYRK